MLNFKNSDPINGGSFKLKNERDYMLLWKTRESEVDFDRWCHCSVVEPKLVENRHLRRICASDTEEEGMICKVSTPTPKSVCGEEE